MTIPPMPSFAHISAMSDERGTFEHADHTEPRLSHGYCTDDMARLLVVAMREPDADGTVRSLARTAFRFVADAQSADGKVRNRMTDRGRWVGRHGIEDCWGRAVWGFGTAAARSDEEWLWSASVTSFERSAEQRSPWPRAMAFAALGAAELVAVESSHRLARRLLADAATVIGHALPDLDWPWPEPRLTYANAVLPDALMAIGSALDRTDMVDDGLRLLEWLLSRQTNGGHLSVVPAGGADPGDVTPRFDQQPIEAAALADACARALGITHAPVWGEHLERVVGWFLGDNDARSVMFDPATGGCYDGLGEAGPNLNEGTESTLALIATLQHARQLAVVSR
jgi:hypothetical protein